MSATTRRHFIKTIAIVPLVGAAVNTALAENAAMRKALQYQDAPKNGQRCDQCIQYVADAKKKDEGACKVIPNDVVKASGWCTAWAKKA